MAVELKVPSPGESVTEVQIGKWHKKPGDPVKRDEVIVEIESDKATLEVPAPADGTLGQILKKTGDQANVGDVIGVLEAGAGAGGGGASARPSGATDTPAAGGTKAPAPAAAGPVGDAVEEATREVEAHGPQRGGAKMAPATPRAADQEKLRPETAPPVPPRTAPAPQPARPAAATPTPATEHHNGEVEVVPMTPMRRAIAKRLVEAQHTGALLTTFNEVDMTNVMKMRTTLQEAFTARHKVKLGFMSFFVKATIHALKLVPQVNAEIRGTDIVYHKSYDIGIAIGGGKGLVVPILRHAERMSFADIEIAISEYAAKAKDNKIELKELQGGTFTISNGGVYGSLLSTPIINPPQSGILGLHAIQKRAVVMPDDTIAARPMMYIALTYDHRLIDGREAVTFLKSIKEVIEEPARMLIEV